VIKNADCDHRHGQKGGKVMFEGAPKQLLTAKNSLKYRSSTVLARLWSFESALNEPFAK
jgi:excinuclease UvrABC ATPase subunit